MLLKQLEVPALAMTKGWFSTAGAPELQVALRYRAEIDGLRALAVLAVLFYHADFAFASGGFVGVDVFFVISGFLITSIIVQDLKEQKFSVKNFYERRARRILPALFFVSLVCLPLGWLWMFADESIAFGQSLFGVATFSSNFVFWLQSGYFSPAVERMPLVHTWTLGVEEQYYLIVPVALFWCWKFGYRRFFTLFLCIGLASLTLAEWGSRYYPAANFYLLPSRLWELMIGSALAVSTHEKPAGGVHWKANLLGMLGVSMILFSVVMFDAKTRFPSFIGLIPTVGTALVLRFGHQTTLVGRFLGLKPFVAVGLISYSVYLWHQPLFAFARIKTGQELTSYSIGILIFFTFVLAVVTWRFIEVPIRRRTFIKTKIVLAASATSVSLLAIGGAVFVNKTVAYRNFTVEEQAILNWLQYARQGLYREGECFLLPEQTFRDFPDSCVSSSSQRPSDAIVVWGDSYAAAVHLGIFSIAGNRVRAQFTASACPPLIGFVFAERPNCPAINNFVINKIRELGHADVFLHANWRVYASDPEFSKRLLDTLKTLKEVGSNPIVVGATPQWYPSLPQVLVKKNLESTATIMVPSDQIRTLTDIDRRVAQIAQEAGAAFIDILPLLCNNDACRAFSLVNGKAIPLVWDSGHLTKEGSELVGQLVLPVVRTLLQP